MTQIKTLDLMTAAVAAYRINNKRIFRNDSKKGLSNQNIINSILNGDVASTDSDRVQAEEIIANLVQRHTMATLSGKDLTQFAITCITFLDQDTVHKRYIGVVAWAPKVYEDLIKADQLKHEFTVLSYGSKYLGRVKERVTVNFTTISVRYNTYFQAWRYTGHDNNGNLVAFLTGTELSSTNVQIAARIRATEVSNYTGGKTTILNQVREIKSDSQYNAL